MEFVKYGLYSVLHTVFTLWSVKSTQVNKDTNAIIVQHYRV